MLDLRLEKQWEATTLSTGTIVNGQDPKNNSTNYTFIPKWNLEGKKEAALWNYYKLFFFYYFSKKVNLNVILEENLEYICRKENVRALRKAFLDVEENT